MISVEQRLQEMEKTITNLAKYNKITNYEAEDLEQDLRLLVCQLHTRFDESRNVKFKTYFVASAKNFIKGLHGKYNIEKSFVSFNEIGDLGEEMVENFPSEENDYDITLLNEVLDYLDTIPMGFITREYYLEDLTQEEIAKKHKVSQQMIAKNLKNNTELLKTFIQSWL
jgi:RNA polymerase sigma factor (sigma-70 family)